MRLRVSGQWSALMEEDEGHDNEKRDDADVTMNDEEMEDGDEPEEAPRNMPLPPTPRRAERSWFPLPQQCGVGFLPV
jgi:hypothetical protein